MQTFVHNDTDAKLMTTLEEIVNERPDYVYPGDQPEGCVYIRDGAPSCLIGHLLVRMGVPAGRVSTHENTCAYDVVGSLIPGSSYPMRHFLDNVQTNQDLGHSWRIALDAALVNERPTRAE